MRAFLRHCYMEGWVEEPIHERFKPVKTQEDTLEAFTLLINECCFLNFSNCCSPYFSIKYLSITS